MNTEHGSYTYEYDKLYRLTSAANPSSADEVYAYDEIGTELKEDKQSTGRRTIGVFIEGFDHF